MNRQNMRDFGVPVCLAIILVLLAGCGSPGTAQHAEPSPAATTD